MIKCWRCKQYYENYRLSNLISDHNNDKMLVLQAILRELSLIQLDKRS
jgi:hypothetical protein